MLQACAAAGLAMTLAASGVSSAAPAAARAGADLAVRRGGHLVGKVLQDGVFARVQRLDIPADHTIGDGLIAYEGVGWESDKVAYRLYLDERLVTDIFGKRQPAVVLPSVGRGPSYHDMAPWGMDVFHVGPSLGVGGLGVMQSDAARQVGRADHLSAEVLQDGPRRARVLVTAKGLQAGGRRYDLSERYTISAGSRLTFVDATTSAPVPLAAGLAKAQGVTALSSAAGAPGDWAWIAQWGHQSLAGPKDDLGTAVVYRRSEVAGTGEDASNLLVRFRPELKGAHYAFAAAWDQEPGGIRDEAGLRRYLDGVVAELDRRAGPR